jgi:hypothetical protein
LLTAVVAAPAGLLYAAHVAVGALLALQFQCLQLEPSVYRGALHWHCRLMSACCCGQYSLWHCPAALLKLDPVLPLGLLLLWKGSIGDWMTSHQSLRHACLASAVSLLVAGLLRCPASRLTISVVHSAYFGTTRACRERCRAVQFVAVYVCSVGQHTAPHLVPHFVMWLQTVQAVTDK